MSILPFDGGLGGWNPFRRRQPQVLGGLGGVADGDIGAMPQQPKGLMGFVQNNPELLLSLGSAISSSGNIGQGLGQGFQNYQQMQMQKSLWDQKRQEASMSQAALAEKAAERKQRKEVIKQFKESEAYKGLSPRERAYFDLNPEKAIEAITKSNNPASVKEYEYARKQGFGGSYMDYVAAKKPSGVTVNAGGPEPSEMAFQKEVGKIHAKRLGSMLDGAEVSRNMVDKLQIMENLMDEGLETGRLQRAMVPMQQLASDFGIKADGLSEKETFRALSNQLALTLRNPESGMGLTGNTSNRDVIFLKESVPGLEKSEAGNRLILKAFKKFEERKIQVANIAEQYAIENGTLAGFQDYMEDWSEQNPLFTEEERREIEAAAKGQPDTGGIIWDQ